MLIDLFVFAFSSVYHLILSDLVSTAINSLMDSKAVIMAIASVMVVSAAAIGQA